MSVHLPAIGVPSALPPPPPSRVRSASMSSAELGTMAAAARLHSAAIKQPAPPQPQPVSSTPILLFIKVFGCGVAARSLEMDVSLSCTLRDLKAQLSEHLPHLHLMRLLYAGRLLSDDQRTLSSFELYKEATIQALTRPKTEEEIAEERRRTHLQQLSNENAQPGQMQSPVKAKWSFLRRKISEQFSPPPKMPLATYAQQQQRLLQSLQHSTAPPPRFDPVEAMQFGEAIIVSVLAARGIKSGGGLFRSSSGSGAPELYVLCVLQGSVCRGSTRKSSSVAAATSSTSSSSTASASNACSVEWNETLGLWRQIVPIPPASTGRASAIQRARAFAAATSSAAVSAASSSVAAASSIPVAPAASAATTVAHKRDRLHMLLFAHDFLSSDEPLGHVQLSVDSLPLARGVNLESGPTWHALGGSQAGGELLLQVERCALSSQQMLVAWQAAIKSERPLPLAIPSASPVAPPPPSSIDPSQAALSATHNTRLLRAIRAHTAFNLPTHLQHLCMTEDQKRAWSGMQIALREHEAVTTVRRRLESAASAAATVTAVADSGSNVPSPASTPRSLSSFSFACAGAFGSSLSASSLHSSPLLQFSSGAGSSSSLLAPAPTSAAAALPAALWNPALFHVEQCILRSLASQHHLSAAASAAPNLSTALSPLFASPVAAQLVWHALVSQKLIVPPSPAAAPSAPRFSRMLWAMHLPLDLTAREFHSLLFRPLSLPSPPAVPAVAAGSSLAVKSYVYSARARMAFVVCSNAEQATLCMLRLRSLILAASPLAPLPLFAFAPDERTASATAFEMVQCAAHVGFGNVSLPAAATPMPAAAAGAPKPPQQQSSAADSFRSMLLHLDVEGVLRGFDREQLLGSCSGARDEDANPLTPAFTLRIAPVPMSLADGSSASPRVSLAASSNLILLRTAPLSFEIVCNNHASVYRVQLGSSTSTSAAAAAVVGPENHSTNWLAFGLGKSDMDRWMTELKALRGARGGSRRPSIAAALVDPIPSSSSSTSHAAPTVGDLVQEIESPLRFPCMLCKEPVRPEALYWLDQHQAAKTTHTCRSCLTAVARRRFLSSASASAVSACAAASATCALEFSTLDLSDLLSQAEYAQYVEASTQRLLAPLRPRTLSFNDEEPAASMEEAAMRPLLQEAASLDRSAAVNSQVGSRFTQCPSCHIHISVDRPTHTATSLESDDSTRAWWGKQIGVDGRPPSVESYELFVTSRVLCRNSGCSSSFCSLCLASPFHLGLSCAEFVEFAQAPKCRFCLTGAVTSRNRLEGPAGEVLSQVCGEPECKTKAVSSCLRRHPGCGHVCGGVRNESQCLPCLDPACVALRPSLTNSVDAQGECGICFTESLGQAPAIRLDSCGHILHLSCILERIRANWSGNVEAGCNEGFRQLILAGCVAPPPSPPADAPDAEAPAGARGEPRVHFNFLGCALCGVRMAHGSSSSSSSSSSSASLSSSVLSEVMAPYLAFETLVHAQAAKQFLAQSLASHIKWPGFKLSYDEARKQRKGDKRAGGGASPEPSAETLFALDQLSFYTCFECKKPYFAGARECGPADGGAAAAGAGGAGVLSSELLCSSCASQSSLDHCALHGSDWLLFKCRFCCASSTYCCWDNTHFCNACHEQDVWPTLCTFATGKNARRIYEYPQCEGLAKQIARVMKDKTLRSPEDKEAACAALFSDPASCPLRVRHKPNGVEFGLGCAMCKDAKAESANRRKEIEVAQAKRVRLQALRKRMSQLIPSARGSSSGWGSGTNEPCYMLLPIELQASTAANPVAASSSLYDLSSMEDLPCFGPSSLSSSAATSAAPSPSTSPKRALSLCGVDWTDASSAADKPVAKEASLLKPQQAPGTQADKENTITVNSVLARAPDVSLVSKPPAQGRGAKLLQQHQQRMAVAPAAASSSAVAVAPNAALLSFSMGLVQYLGTDAGTHAYINPADPSLPSSAASSYLCDVTLSSLDESLQPPPAVPGIASRPAPVWRCLNELDGVSSALSGQQQPTVVRTRSYPFSTVQIHVFHLALQVTHYAVYLPAMGTNGSAVPATAANPSNKASKSASGVASSSSATASVSNPPPSAADHFGFMTSWRLEGSNAGVHWEVIDERVNDTTLVMHARAAETAANAATALSGTSNPIFSSLSLPIAPSVNNERRRVIFSVPTSSPALTRRFSLFRLVQTNFAAPASPSSSPSHVLSCHGLELFGALYPAISDADYLAHSEAALESKLHQQLTKRGGTFTLPSQADAGPNASAAPSSLSITPGLDVPLSCRGLVALNRGSAKWRAIRVEEPILLSVPFGAAAASSLPLKSVYVKSFRILLDPATTNSWHWTIGVVSAGFNFGSRCWIGAQSGSWGYIGGTGGVCHESGLSSEYGRPYGLGDVISVRVDVAKGTVEFGRNGVWQGVAFSNLPRISATHTQPPLYLAVAMHAVRAHIQIE